MWVVTKMPTTTADKVALIRDQLADLGWVDVPAQPHRWTVVGAAIDALAADLGDRDHIHYRHPYYRHLEVEITVLDGKLCGTPTIIHGARTLARGLRQIIRYLATEQEYARIEARTEGRP